MQVSLENSGNLGRKLTVQVPSAEIEEKITGRIRDLAKKVTLKGFRPGKIPFKVLVQRYGQRVRQEVVGEVIQQSFEQAINQEQLRPVSQPEISTEAPKLDQDLEFTAAFDVYPELEALDVSAVEIEQPEAEVLAADVDNMIETLRQQRQTWEDVDRAAGDSDLVFFSYSIQSEQRRYPEEGEERAGAILGSGAFNADFEAQLLGLSLADEKQFEASFNADFREPALAGFTGKASVTIEKVQASKLPEVDDEFVASFGVSEGGVDAFRKNVQANMNRELKQAVSRLQRNEVLNKLVSEYGQLEAPLSMVEAETVKMQQQAQQLAQQQGLTDPELPPADNFKDQAEHRVRAALLVREVARHASLQIDAGRVRDMVNEMASTYESPQSIINLYYSDEKLLANIQSVVLEEQAVEWVLERAKVKTRAMTFDQVMKPETEAGGN